MIKKFLLLSVVVSQLSISCSSNDDAPIGTKSQVAMLLETPYSSLTTEEQKDKLAIEADEMLEQMEDLKSTPAQTAVENLENLFSMNMPDIDFPTDESGKSFQEVLNVSDVYGIYTWNSVNQVWDYTESATELKFVFPATENETENNAILTASSIASNVKEVVDGEEMYLPSSVNAILTIDGTEVGSYEANSVYSNGNPEPIEAGYKLTLNGYTFENSAKRTSPVSVKTSFSHNGANLVEFNVGSTADINKIMEDEDVPNQYFGKANCLITLMDNFVLVADADLEGWANDMDASDISYDSEAEAAAFNNNVKMALVSKKDGTKIADVVERAVNSGDENNGTNWYLHFKDGSEVAMNVYFTEGFDDLTTKFQDFLSSFN